MKAKITFYIGLFVAVLSITQYIISFEPVRFFGIGVGLFFMVFGWKIGWTTHKGFTTVLGHIAMVVGCLLTAYGIYQLPFLEKAPTVLEVFDMPLFWGLFTIFGGYCMITHGFCNCAAGMHNKNNCIGKECGQ